MENQANPNEEVQNQEVNTPEVKANGFPDTPDGKVTVPKKRTDYFGLKFYGNNDRDIKRMQSNDPGINLTLMPREKAFEHYAEDAKAAGIDWTPETFNSMYDQAEKQLVQYKKGMYDVGVNYDETFNRRHTGFHAEAISPYQWDPRNTAYDLFPEIDTRWVMENGEVTRVKTDDQFIVEDLRWYKPIVEDGNEVANTFMYGEDLSKNRTYKEIEVGGRKMRVGDLEADYDKFFGGAGLKSGPEGTTGLAIKYDEKGLPYAQEVSLYEKVHGDAIMSMAGPRSMRQEWYENLWDATITNTIAKLPAASVGFVDWLDDVAGKMNAWTFGEQGGKWTADDYVDEADTFYRNWGSAHAVKTPNNILEAGTFDNAQSFWWNAGGALGSVAQVLLTRKATGAFGKVFGLSDEAAASLGATMGSSTMAITAADGFKQSMIENGISEDAQLLLYGPALLGSFMVERMGMNIIDDGLQAFYAKQNIKEYVNEGIKETLRSTGKSSASELTKEELKATGKKLWAGMLEQSKSLASKSYDLTKRGIMVADRYAPVAVKAAWEEGTEEVLEGRIYSSLETIHDWWQNYTLKDSRNLDRYAYTKDGESFYEVDQITGIRRKVTEATYNKLSAGQNVKPGQGMFAEYNPELGFVSNWATHAQEGILDDFVLGAFAGGIVAGANQILGAKDLQKERILQDYVINGKGETVRKQLEKMHKKGMFGPTDVSADDKIIDPNDPNAVSLNDLGYQTALKELEEAELTFQATGITEGSVLKEMMESSTGMSLLREAYDNVSNQRRLQSEIEKLNEDLSATQDQQMIKNIQEQIEDKTRQKEDLNLQLKDIRSGQRMKENITNNVVKKWSNDNNLSMVDPEGKSFIPTATQLKRVNDRYDQAKQEQIQKIQEASQKRVQLENQVSQFTGKKGIDQSSIFEQISDIQIKASEVGLSESNTKAMIGKLQDVRKQILDSFDQYFSAEEIEEAQATADITGETLAETLLSSDLSNNADAQTAHKFYNDLEASIRSFNVEQKPEVKVGDFVQWKQAGQDQFDKPRKLEKISEDGEFGFVEGSDTGIPMEQIVSPEFQGERIVGSTPESFDEQSFKRSFYDTYVDTQGNNVSISKTIEDLASRKMNEEDLKTIQLLRQAINNNAYLASVNANVLNPLTKDKKIDIGSFKPSPDSMLSGSDLKAIVSDLGEKELLLNMLSIMQQKDVNDKKNREGRLRFNDYKIRNFIIEVAGDASALSLDAKTKLIDLNAKIKDSLTGVHEAYLDSKEYSREDLDRIEPLIVEAEHIIHLELNGENRNDVIESIAKSYKVKRSMPAKSGRIYHSADEFVMHDFDSVFDSESFTNPVDSSDRSVANLAKEQFANVYFTNHIQTLDRLSPKHFFDYYANVAAGLDLESGQVPSYEQVRSIYHVSAFMVNAKTDSLWKIQDLLTGAENKASKELHFNRALFVRGFAGTGKTSLVIKYAANIYADMKGAEGGLVIDTCAPSTELQKNLSGHLVDARANHTNPGMSFNALLEHIADPSSTISKSDLIIIDEASNLRKEDLQNLRDALRKSKAKNTLKVIFLGDQSQMTSVNAREFELVAVERVMERTMPTTEVFRSGAADISNLQSAYRKAIFRNQDAILPKGTYDKDKNNGLHYFGGTKREMFDSFADDLNNGDSFKKENTALIVYTKADREAAINYIRKQLKDPIMDLESKIKTIEEGEFSAQGLEYGRIYVAIDEADAQYLYNPAMLTAISRAKKIDEDHNGFASVLSTKGFSQEGEPIIVQVKTATPEDIERHKTYVSLITGKSLDPVKDVKKDASSQMGAVTQADYDAWKSNMQSILGKNKIEFIEAGFESDGLKFRYKIKGKPVQSVTQKLSGVITKPDTERTLDPHAKRGSAIHKIVEAYLNKQQKKGGKLFTKADIEAIKKFITSYNEQVDAWNATASEESKLQTISMDTDDTVFETNKFVQDVIANVAIPIAAKLNQGGKFSMSEAIIGIYFNDIAGTMDILDLVGMDGGIPVVDIYDLKTLTPGSYKWFEDTASATRSGMIESPTGDTFAASGLNKALCQMGTYKAIMEQGDPETGLKQVKVRNVNIVKSSLTGAGEVSSLMNDDFVQYDTESEDFKKFKEYGLATVEKGVILQEKNTKFYQKNHPDLSKIFTDADGETFEVTGIFKDPSGQTWFEINGDINNPMAESEYTARIDASINIEPGVDPVTSTRERVYKRSAANHRLGSTFSFGTASTFVDNGKAGWENDHFRFKSELFKVLSKRLGKGVPNSAKVNLIFHPEIELINDQGELQPFKNIVAAYLSDDFMPDAINAAKNLPWAKEMSDADIAKELKARNYMLLSTLAHPDSNFGVTERDIDYTDEAQVKRLIQRIKEGFIVDGVEDEFKPSLVKYHSDLASYRAKGAKTPGEVFATVRIANIEDAAVIYDGQERSYDSLMSSLSAKGFKIGKPYFGSKLWSKKDSNGRQVNIASWAVDVWRISPSIDRSRIILRTGEHSDLHHTELKKSVDDLRSNKASTLSAINQSLAMIFIRQNRTWLIDSATGKITSEIPELSKYLKVENNDIDLNVDGKVTIPALLNSLTKAIDLLNNARKSNVRLATMLRSAVPFTIGDKNMRIIPPGMESRLFTSASDVNSFGINLDMSQIDTKDTSTPSNSDEERRSRRPLINPNSDEDIIYDDEMPEEETNMFIKKVNKSVDPDKGADPKPDLSTHGFAKRYFGDEQLMNLVKRDVARVLIENSNWNRDINTPSFTISDMIAKAWEYYQAASQMVQRSHMNIDVTSGDVHYKSLSEISGANVHLIKGDPEAFTDYVDYVVGNDFDLFIALVDKAIPNLDLKKMSKKQDLGEAFRERLLSFEDKNEQELTENDIDNRVNNENSQTSVMDSIDSRPFSDTMSGLLHLHINQTPLKKYVERPNGDVEGIETTRFVNPDTIHKHLLDAAQMSVWADEDTLGLDRVQRWKHHFWNMALSAGVGSPTYDHLMSFYDVFFNTENPKLRSHLFIRNNSFRPKGTQSYLESAFAADPEIVKAKGKASDLLLSALYAHFASPASKKNMQAEVRGFGEQTSRKQKSQSLSVGVHIVREIKSRINNTLFSLGEKGLEVNDEVASKITSGKNQIYEVNSSGVFDKSGGKIRKLIQFTTQNNKIVSFQLASDITTQEVKDMMNVLEIKELVYVSTLKQYLATEKDDNPNPEARRDREKLAEIVGMMMLTAKAAVSPDGAETSLLKSYYQENGYQVDSLSDMNDDMTVDVGDVGQDIYKPSDLYRLIENIAKAQSEIQLNNHADFYYNVKGDKVWRHTNGAAFWKMFVNGDLTGNLPSSGLKKWVEREFMNDENIESLRYNPLLMITESGVKILNTILDPNSGHDIVDIFQIDGTKSSFKAVAHGSDMTDLDYADFAVNTMFIQDILSGKKIQNVKIPFHQISNKRGVIVSHFFGANRFTFNEDKHITVDMDWVIQNIVDIFRYHNNARRASYLKWRNVLTSAGLTIDENVFSGWMQSPDSFALILDQASEALPDGALAEIVKRNPDLIEIQDYVIDKKTGKVLPGKRPMMDIDAVYNWNNLNRLQNAITHQNALIEFRGKFEQAWNEEKEALAYGTDEEFNALTEVEPEKKDQQAIDRYVQKKRDLLEKQMMKEAGIKTRMTVEELINSMFYTPHKDAAISMAKMGFRLDSKIGETFPFKKRTGQIKGIDVNPTLKSFFWAFHIADHHLSQAVMGDVTQYKDPGEIFKRSSGPFAPAWNPDTTSPRGIGPKSKVVILEDIEGEVYEQLQNVFGHRGDHTETDGLGIINPISLAIMKNSFGGEEIGVVGQGMLKPVYFKNDLLTHRSIYLKYALLPMTEQIMRNSSAARMAFQKMVNQPGLEEHDLYGKWEAGMSIEDLAEYVVENGLQSQIVMQAVFKSGNKTGNAGVQRWDDPQWMTSIEIDNDYFGIQLNAEQSIDQTENLSGPAQLNATIGIGPHNVGIASQINQLKADIALEALADMSKEFYVKGEFKRDKFEKYLRNLGIQSAEKTGEITKLAEMLNDPEIDINIPTTRAKLIQLYMNKIKSEAISPRWNGVRMSQAPGFFFDLVVAEDGTIYMENEAIKRGIVGQVRKLQPMKFYADEAFTQEIMSADEFQSRLESGEIFFKPAEVIMPFSYFEKFGLKKYLDRDPNFSLNDVFMIETPEGLVNIKKSIDDPRLESWLDEIYSAKKNAKKEGVETESEFFLNEEFSSAKEAIKWLKNFREALKVVHNRIPNSSSSFASAGEIVGWINDNGNTIFTSAQKNILDGGDYDIDQLNTYFKFVDDKGRIVTGDGKKAKINQMFDLILQYYKDPNNGPIFMKRLTLQKLEDQIASIKESRTEFKNYQNDWGTNLNAYDNIKQGDALVGIFANAIKTFSYLTHVSFKNDVNYRYSSKLGIGLSVRSGGELISNILERFLNAALDNVKESILGYMGATEDAGNIISAAIISGYDENEVGNLLMNKTVVDVFRKMKYSKRVANAKTLNIHDAIDNKISDIENDDAFEMRKELEAELDAMRANLGIPLDEIKVSEKYIDDQGIEWTRTPRQIEEERTAILDEWYAKVNELTSKLNNQELFDQEKRDQLDTLYRLRDLAYLGEALYRLNTVVKIDSTGIPVFDYQLDKLIRDIEYNIGMPLEDFLAGKEAAEDWYKSRRTFITSEENEKLERREPAIRSYIKIGNVVKELPHIMAYLHILNDAKKNMSNSFVRNSKMMNDLVDTFLGRMKQDWFRNERAYYSFYSELDDFMIAVYFSTQLKHKRFRTITGIDRRVAVNVGTREGRYQFGMEFPTSVMEKIDARNATPDDELSPQELELKRNLFLKSLTKTSTPSGDFLEFRNSWKLKEEDKADLRAAFRALPVSMQEDFYIYQLAKDGFQFTKGGLYEAIDNGMFKGYSRFLEEVKAKVDDYIANNETPFEFIDINGELIPKKLSETLNAVFLTDVGYYSDDMAVLQYQPKDGFEEHLEPDQYKVSEKVGDWRVMKVKLKGDKDLYQGSAKKTFNAYDPLNSTLTTMDVIRKISMKAYKDLKDGKRTTIKFNGKIDFMLVEALIADGSAVRIAEKTANTITLIPIKINTLEEYRSKKSKKDLLDEIGIRSKNELFRNLARFISQNVSDSILKKGKVEFTTTEADPEFSEKAKNGKKSRGYWNSSTRNIKLNSTHLETPQDIEKTFLHEEIHDITYHALHATDKELENLGEQGQRIKQFRDNIDKIYNKAKEYYDAEGLSFYGMKDRYEFVSEALSNSNFQMWLKEKPIEETVGTGFLDKVKNLYQALIGSIKNLLGITDKDAPYTMLDQVVGLFAQFAESGDYDFESTSTKEGDNISLFDDSQPETEIKETKDIIGFLQPEGFSKTYSQYRQEQLINDIYNGIDSKTGVYFYNGEKFYFKTKAGEIMDELSAKAKIEKEVLPRFTEFEDNYKKSVIGWLSNGAQIDGSVPGVYFPKKGGQSRYNPGTLAEIRRLMDHNVNDVYIRYSDLKNNPDFKNIPHLPEFEGYDPIVVIHKSIDSDEMSISLFDATSLRLNKKGILEGNIFKKFIKDDYEARSMGVNLGNNEGDVRRLMLGLQAMAMKQANPNLKIKHIGVLSISNKSVDSVWVYMDEFMENVKAMKSIERFKTALPDSIMKVIEDQSLYKDDYDQPWIFMLRRKFQERVQDLKDIEGQEYHVKKINDSIGQMDAYLNGQGSKEEMIQIMTNRMHELESKYKKDEDLLNDPEYIYLSNTLKELTEIPSMEKMSTKDLDKVRSFLSPTVDISHDIISWAQEAIYRASRMVQDKVREFQTEKLYPQLRDFNERYFKKHPEQRSLDYLQDLAGKKFLPLFKMRKVKDESGNEVEINSLEIHWNENDPDTQEALRTNKISIKDVEFGKFIVDTLEEQMIENILHLNRFEKGYKREDAQKDLDRKWRKGMIPAMSGSVNEMLMKKDPKSVKAGLKKFMDQLVNLDDIYDEVDKQKLKDTKRQKILKEMTDYFMNQIGLDSDVYGSDARMGIMGIKNGVSGPVLLDPIANQNLSTNLELIVMYMVSSSERKRVFDKKVLPYVNAAQTMLFNPQISRIDGDQEQAMSYFQNYINSVLKGMPEKLDSKIAGVDVDKFIGTTVGLATFNGLALNVPVAMASGLMNAGQFMNNAISNDIATNGFYGKKEAAQAIKMFGTKEGRRFIEAIVDLYKIADRSERDLVHNPRMKVTNRNIFTSHHAFWMNWYTDYNIRGIVAAAQMIKDGSINAYSLDEKTGKLVYDESKDPNWQGEDGQHLKNFVKQRLVEEGVMKSVDEKMPRGYDHKMAYQLKHLADKYIIGNIDDNTKGRFGRTVAAKPWMQFIGWLPNKMTNYFGSTKVSPVGGRYVVRKNEYGEAETHFEKSVQEGIFVTFKNLAIELHKNKYRSKRSWTEMQPHERYNIMKFGVDMITFSVLYGLYAGLTADWDDEEPGVQSVVADSRLMKVLKYAAMDYVVFNPLDIAGSLAAIPVLEQAERLSGIFVGDFSAVERSLPLSTTVRSFAEILSSDEN